ncbi:MAG: hypothetical protein PVSMB7_30010 [Chloroflexota bacterium]
MRRWFRCTYDLARSLQNTEDRYEIIQDGQVVQSQAFASSHALTWYRLSEVIRLLTDVGFVDAQAYGDFTETPATDADTGYVVVGKRSS